MKLPLKQLTVLRARGNQVSPETVSFADEKALGLAARGRLLTELMATPGQERELAVGYALTMGWLRLAEGPPEARHLAEQGRVELDLDIAPEELGTVRAAGGGLLGPTEADPLPPGQTVELEVARGLIPKLGQGQVLYPRTRGTHAAALFNAGGDLLALAEDVGRHNSLDKAVGSAWLAGVLDQAVALALSGRCSLEMVLKAVRSRVGLVVSVSAPTVPAVEAADRLGLTLVNSHGPEELRVYTHPGRLTQKGQPLTLD
ncbi:MAG: formate dehydrogenase accessory sulfurtransferase FdhD [Desulfarculaceae bacterium]|nr:formate dehydrogenase accessory sulfurtransferase FdhD [Desulfarculaceae bacterium]MCF8103389.1 formate dehydrogenase accessory sulfurtransferase FdhD [Desulfarculaceae bacterium]MCF8117756.1 formate dehydrogenase accessory sulfurtransferase FdhD [Desulfarculaceae bacterium]